ncbi:MAG: calcium/proton exchanger [Anaerolineales bacterium]
MKGIFAEIMNLGFIHLRKIGDILLLLVPLSILAEFLNWGEILLFLFSALAIIPLAGYIGESTDILATATGPRIGGLLNATLGNAAELIITIIAIREGLLELVKASITGSILGNVLLVLGMSMVLGGIKNGVQIFDRRQAGNNAILLVLAVIALLIPSLLSGYIGQSDSPGVEALSIGVAIIMIVLYILGVVYSLKTDRGPLSSRPSVETNPSMGNIYEPEEMTEVHPAWSTRKSIVILGLATFGVVIMSELLIGSVEPVMLSLGISEFFLGIILIPIIGNVAEHLVAVKVAIQNKMELSVEIAIASSLQIALFVAPVLVFVSLFIGNPMQLIFNEVELLALVAGVLITALVSSDGESNWLEGAELVAVYLILALTFFLMPV